MKAIIGIGLPGSGKTTVLKPLAEKEHMTYINADDIRHELTGDATNHSLEPLVWKLARLRIATALQHGNILLDATHTKTKDRKTIIAFCRQHGATKVIGYWIKPTLDETLARNMSRRRQVREQAIHKMANRISINPPSLDEGFDELVIIET